MMLCGKPGFSKRVTRLGIDNHLVEWNRRILLDRVSVLGGDTTSLEVHLSCGMHQGPHSFFDHVDDLVQDLRLFQRVGR